MNTLTFRAFTTELAKIATEVRDADIQAMLAAGQGKEYLPGGQLPSNTEPETNFKPKLAAGFMAFTPIGTYSVVGKKHKADTPAYETASNYAGTVLKGGMTGAGAASLGHTIMHGHVDKISPKLLGKATAIGAGVALTDRFLRRRTIKNKLEQTTEKKAGLSSETFTPARELHANQEMGRFENKLHMGVVKSKPATIGRLHKLPTQGV